MDVILIELRVVRKSETIFETQIKENGEWHMSSAIISGMHKHIKNEDVWDKQTVYRVAEAANKAMSNKIKTLIK